MKRFLRQLIIAIACFGPVLLMGLGAALMSGKAFPAGVHAPSLTQVDPLVETRWCGEPKRNVRGEIIRRADVLAAFRRAHPCPSTGLSAGACPGWSIDHTVSLSVGGCDSVSNAAWLPNVIKSGPGQFPKDRWERKVYADPPQIVLMPASGVLRLDAPTNLVTP